MTIRLAEYPSLPWAWQIYRARSGTDASGNTTVTFAAWGNIAVDFTNLTALAQHTSDGKPPVVGTLLTAPGSIWYEIITVAPADHACYRLTLRQVDV
jgi:hypothetical protein